MLTRPLPSTSTTVAFIGSTKSFMGQFNYPITKLHDDQISDPGRGCHPHGIVHTQDDGRGRPAIAGSAVRVFDVDARVRNELQGGRQRARNIRESQDDDGALGDLVMTLAPYRHRV